MTTTEPTLYIRPGAYARCLPLDLVVRVVDVQPEEELAAVETEAGGIFLATLYALAPLASRQLH